MKDSISRASQPLSDLASLRRVWAIAGKHRRSVILGLIFRFAQSSCLGMAYAVAVHVVTELAGARFPDNAWILHVVLVLVVSLVGQLIFGYLAMRSCWFASFAIGRDLRLALLDHMRLLPPGFPLERGRGDVLSTLTSDTQFIESFFSDGLPRIAQALGLPLTLILFFAFQAPLLAAAASVSICVGLPVFLWSSRALARQAVERQDKQAAASESMIEFARGMPVIRSFNRMESGQKRFNEAVTAFRDISIRMVRQLAVPMVAFGAIVVLGAPIIMASSGVFIAHAMFDRDIILSVLVLVFSFYTPLLGLVAVMEHVRIADASLARIQRILDSRPLPVLPNSAKPSGTTISFENICFSYDGLTKVLNDITVNIPERTMTAVVGASGSGKSTLLSLMVRFFDPTQGIIRVGGMDIRSLSEEQLSDLVTMVFQDVYLFSGTIIENIALARPNATQIEIETAAKQAHAHEFIIALPNGYQTQVGEGGASLSGGERQRISIARALLKDAPIVLLDEATSAIDPLTERDLQKALANLTIDRTVIVVAHKLSTISQADQILVLDKGQIVEKGTDTQLRAFKGVYSRFLTARTLAEAWKI